MPILAIGPHSLVTLAFILVLCAGISFFFCTVYKMQYAKKKMYTARHALFFAVWPMFDVWLYSGVH